MSETDDFDPIAASLRRQFSPPDMDALADRIEREAALRAEEVSPPRATVVELPTRRPRRAMVAVAAVGAVAAAALLWMLRPAPSPEPLLEVTEGTSVAQPPPFESVPPTSSEQAGAQLHAFLQRDAPLPSTQVPWTADRPQEVCGTDGPQPQFVESEGVRLLGECGGRSGHLCSDFDLPAGRALLVEFVPEGTRAVVCIERPWTDPSPELPSASPYRKFTSQLGDFTVHEITPEDAPRASAAIRL